MIGFKKSGIMCLAASVVLTGVLAGCSGSGGGGVDQLIPFNSQVNSTSGTSQQTITAGATDVLATANVTASDSSIPGGVADILVPAGETVMADEPVGLLAGEQTLFTDTTVEGGRAPGDITLNGKVLGKAYIDRFGRIRVVGSDTSKRPVFIALPRNRTWSLSIQGPFTVRAKNADLTRGFLTIQTASFYFFTDSVGNIHLPKKLSGSVPANGTQTPVGWKIDGTYASSSNGDAVRLKITHSNGVMDRSTNVLSSAATFTNSAPGSNDLIPTTGVTEVHYGQGPTGTTVP